MTEKKTIKAVGVYSALFRHHVAWYANEIGVELDELTINSIAADVVNSDMLWEDINGFIHDEIDEELAFNQELAQREVNE